jgi:hypothetical protein
MTQAKQQATVGMPLSTALNSMTVIRGSSAGATFDPRMSKSLFWSLLFAGFDKPSL